MKIIVYADKSKQKIAYMWEAGGTTANPTNIVESGEELDDFTRAMTEADAALSASTKEFFLSMCAGNKTSIHAMNVSATVGWLNSKGGQYVYEEDIQWPPKKRTRYVNADKFCPDEGAFVIPKEEWK